jgi:Fe(3+) dicitrate transport protein
MISKIMVGLLFFAVVITSPIYSQGSVGPVAAVDSDTLTKASMPQIEVIGRQDRFVRVPGSAALISFKQIQNVAHLSGNEVIRSVSGVHVVDEEGLGLRANIGIRGLDPDRSRTVLVLEDGVPVALNPYGEPELYYTPAMDRMIGMEVLKGSGSILFGPQTFGGVINYLSANPPAVPTATAHVRAGGGGFFTGRFGYGTTYGNTGFQATYLRKQGNNVGLVDFGLHDFNTKVKLVLGRNTVLGLKAGFYDERSNSTYVGLTQAMYDSGDYYFTQLAPDDELSIRRYSASATLDHYFSDSVRLNTTAFAYTTTRNWARQDFDSSPATGRDYVRILGDPSIPFGAIYFRNTTGNRDRQFEVIGIEPRLSVNYSMGVFKQELDLGVRFLFEKAYEQFVIGSVNRPTSGVMRDDEIRSGRALSAYIQNRVFISEAFTVTPGVRVEYVKYDREIFRLGNQEVDTRNSNHVTEVIPGIGMNYKISDRSSLYAGVHRGFGPPRTKDAISSSGVAEDLDAEQSWNYELGTRTNIFESVGLEVTLFYMDFSNQIIPVSESSGGAGTGLTGLVNGGETRHMGLETKLDMDLGALLNLQHGLMFRTAATIANSEFANDRYVMVTGQQMNVNGNSLPYAPEIMINSRVDASLSFGLSLGVELNYIGEQYTDLVNTRVSALNGRAGLIPSYTIVHVSVGYEIPSYDGASLTLGIKNITDERYIASRRPQGIRPGLPRFISAGFDLRF